MATFSTLPVGSFVYEDKIFIPPAPGGSQAGVRGLRLKAANGQPAGPEIKFPGALSAAITAGLLALLIGDSNSAQSIGGFVQPGEHWNINLLSDWLTGNGRGDIWNAAYGGADAQGALNRVPDLFDTFAAGHPQYTKKFAFVMVGTNNQNNPDASAAITELLRMKEIFHSRGIRFVISTCIVPWDNPATCEAINTYIKANWQALGAEGLLDFSNDTRLDRLRYGTNESGWVYNGGAANNYDKLHWNGKNHRIYFTEYVLPWIEVLANSPEVVYTPGGNTTPAAPGVVFDDSADTVSFTHALGANELVVSTNGGAFAPYAGPYAPGNVALAAGYYTCKVKAATGRNESAETKSPAFTVAGTPPPATVTLRYDNPKMSKNEAYASQYAVVTEGAHEALRTPAHPLLWFRYDGDKGGELVWPDMSGAPEEVELFYSVNDGPTQSAGLTSRNKKMFSVPLTAQGHIIYWTEAASNWLETFNEFV